MSWYDFFSLFYDRTLEDRYAPFRSKAFTTESLGQGSVVLDLACGTGQNFPYLHNVLGQNVQILGVDLSKGMLKRAEKRIKKEGWQKTTCLQKSALSLSKEDLQEHLGQSKVDIIVCSLGLTAFPDWEQAFANSFDLLKPGGRYLIFDVHAETRSFNTKTVEFVARADILRRVWEPLETQASDFSMEFLDNSIKEFGGKLFFATGTK